MKTRTTLIALLLAVPLGALAGDDGSEAVSDGKTIYKTVGPDGQVVFSDTPPVGSKSEKVELPPTNVQPIALPRPLPQRKLSPKDAGQRRDGERQPMGPVDIAIVSPQDGATIPPGQRFIALQVDVAPAYPEGAEFFAVVDGQPWQGGSSGSSLDISALERGTHSVQAVLTDGRGNVLAQSQVITVYVKRPGGTVPDISAPRATQAPKAPVAPGLPQAQPQQRQRRGN
ncbi:DUF4124 domain-containing protein [Microbulbifer marinus]|uniref:DUF4124 domain-containing protein n=1 Tax=Microbulbifer marinus TaxID=658218 RepID=A0A1H3YTY3_9GAMM|nr:DUF4124 domain-containing protein [Microbulbifer marinus]SEA14651.1 protein of unknown function [Microbulbifer marinus]